MQKEIIYGIGGVVIGLVIMLVVQSAWNNDYDRKQNMMGQQSMHDSMMKNNDTSMHNMMQGMTATLEGKSGDEFDKAFLSEMIVHHEGAVEMAKLAEKYAKHQEIKDMSAAIISAQNQEIEQMKAWQELWYK